MKEKEILLKCKCGSHLVGINTEYYEDNEVFIDFYQDVCFNELGFMKRLKFVWNVLRGNKNYIFDIMLSKEEYKKLSNFLIEVGD